jgi:hypothetical protein
MPWFRSIVSPAEAPIMALARVLSSARLVLLGALVLLAAACETLKTGSDYDHAASFAGYHSFTIVSRQHHQLPNALIAQRAEDSIRGYLQSRGYVYVEDAAKADFTVDFTLGAEQRTEIYSYPEPWSSGWCAGPGWWGGPYWNSTLDVRQIQEGTISVNIFDNKTRRPVWHGWAQKTLSPGDVDHSAEAINTAMTAVLGKFPPLSAAASRVAPAEHDSLMSDAASHR